MVNNLGFMTKGNIISVKQNINLFKNEQIQIYQFWKLNGALTRVKG